MDDTRKSLLEALAKAIESEYEGYGFYMMASKSTEDAQGREVFAQHGAPSVTIFASPDHPNVHALLIDVTDMGAFQAWITSPEAAVAKAEDGVLDEGFTVFTPRK